MCYSSSKTWKGGERSLTKKAWLIIILCIISIPLMGCKLMQGKAFINDQKTIEQAHKMVQEEAERKYGITVKPSTVNFRRHGKVTNYDEIYVSYETVEEPVFYGRAFVNVDRKKRTWRLSEVNELGMKYSDSTGSLGHALYKDLHKKKYSMITNEINKYLSENPEFVWDKEGPSLQFFVNEPEREHIEELFILYGAGEFEHLTPTEATEYMEKIEPSNPKYATTIGVRLDYKGEMNHSKMEELVNVIEDIEEIHTLPGSTLDIRVEGDTFDETEEPIYNINSDGEPNEIYFKKIELKQK